MCRPPPGRRCRCVALAAACGAALLSPTAGRCAVSYVNSTVCGGYGDCYHISGPGRHWLGDAECVCSDGYCPGLAKQVVAVEGTVQVWTCWKCDEAFGTATKTVWPDPHGAAPWLLQWHTVMSSVGGEWASLSCPTGAKVIGGGCKRVNSTLDGVEADPVGMWTSLGPAGSPEPSAWECGGSTTGVTDGGAFDVSASTGSGGGRGVKEVHVVCALDRALYQVNVTEAAGGVAECPRGMWLLSGGCRADSAPWETSMSAPLNNTAWWCSGRAENHTSWAVCTPHLRSTVVSQTSVNSSTASCPSGYVVSGGGCGGMSTNATTSIPLTDRSGWYCYGPEVYSDAPVWVEVEQIITAYAVCIAEEVQWCGPGRCDGCGRADLHGGLGGCSWETCRTVQDCRVRCAETADCVGFDFNTDGTEGMRCWFRSAGRYADGVEATESAPRWHYHATTGADGCYVGGASTSAEWFNSYRTSV